MSPRPRYFEALVIIGYIVAVLLGAALLAPVLLDVGQGFLSFASARGWRDSQWIGWIVKAAETTRLPGYFNRAALIVALTGLWPLFRALKLTRADTVGAERFPGGVRNGVRGFILAAAIIALMGVVFSKIGVCRASDSPAWWKFGPPIVSGFCVALIEEFLFRGAMLGVLRRSFQPRMAMLVTTGLFAVLHFLKPPARDAFKDPAVDWTSGFGVLARLFDGFAEWQNVIAEFLLLFAVGWVLAAARVRTGGLGLGIGIHAGLVAAMKYLSHVTTPTASFRRGEFFPWISVNHCKAIVGSYVGVVPIVAVLLIGVLAALTARKSAESRQG